MKIQEIKINDKAYPESLKKIKNPPKKLYVIGNIELLNRKGIAIVGSRNCTKEGTKNARVFGALDVKGKTIAVLGNGPNVIFPYENKLIYDKILKLRWANC